MKKPKPDLRPCWRDPNMPVLRDYRMSDGTTKTIIDPEYERRWREYCMEMNRAPNWKNDPTYHMRKPKS
jgi:hypothetical protein